MVDSEENIGTTFTIHINAKAKIPQSVGNLSDSSLINSENDEYIPLNNQPIPALEIQGEEVKQREFMELKPEIQLNSLPVAQQLFKKPFLV